MDLQSFYHNYMRHYCSPGFCFVLPRFENSTFESCSITREKFSRWYRKIPTILFTVSHPTREQRVRELLEIKTGMEGLTLCLQLVL